MFGFSSFCKGCCGRFLNRRHHQAESREQHRAEYEQFARVLESFDVTRIEERLAVLEVFLSLEHHVSLEELAQAMMQKGKGGQSREFLESTMEMFCRYGFARQLAFENQETRYEHHHLGAHHDHFICIRCGKIEEFHNPRLERLQRHIARHHRFQPLQHKMEVYGFCNACMAERDKTLLLPQATNGERVRIVRMSGDRRSLARLTDMGLSTGVCLEMINNDAAGQVLVALDNMRLAINGELARHIEVKHSCNQG